VAAAHGLDSRRHAGQWEMASFHPTCRRPARGEEPARREPVRPVRPRHVPRRRVVARRHRLPGGDVQPQGEGGSAGAAGAAGGGRRRRGELEEATVKGCHEDALAFGRVANAQGDSAASSIPSWSTPRGRSMGVVEPAGKGSAGAEADLRGRPGAGRTLGLDFERWRPWCRRPGAALGLCLRPAAGMVRLSRAMRTRADIPDAAQFVAQLDALATIGDANGGRRGRWIERAWGGFTPSPTAGPVLRVPTGSAPPPR
jgi:hypothetical protein